MLAGISGPPQPSPPSITAAAARSVGGKFLHPEGVRDAPFITADNGFYAPVNGKASTRPLPLKPPLLPESQEGSPSA